MAKIWEPDVAEPVAPVVTDYVTLEQYAAVVTERDVLAAQISVLNGELATARTQRNIIARQFDMLVHDLSEVAARRFPSPAVAPAVPSHPEHDRT